MNGKKARKLRRLAIEISKAITLENGKPVAVLEPLKVYQELKKIDKFIKG